MNPDKSNDNKKQNIEDFPNQNNSLKNNYKEINQFKYNTNQGFDPSQNPMAYYFNQGQRQTNESRDISNKVNETENQNNFKYIQKVNI